MEFRSLLGQLLILSQCMTNGLKIVGSSLQGTEVAVWVTTPTGASWHGTKFSSHIDVKDEDSANHEIMLCCLCSLRGIACVLKRAAHGLSHSVIADRKTWFSSWTMRAVTRYS